MFQARSEIFHKFFDNPFFPENLRNPEDQIGCGDAGFELPDHPDADDLRYGHIIGLTEHHGLGFNAADTPSEHTDPIDHGRVGIQPDECVRESGGHPSCCFLHHRSPKIFQIHLMAYSGFRGHHAEIGKTLLRPLQEGISFAIAFIFFFNIFVDRIRRAEKIDLHGMIDNQIYRYQGIYFPGIAAPGFDGIPHGCQIHNRRNTGKILHKHPCRVKRNFNRRIIGFLPPRDI